MAFFNILPREDQYFTLFSQMSSKVQEASEILVEMMQDPGANYESYTKRIKDVEHSCDEITHELTTKLNKSFITPFDREDIFTLSVALDDVMDYIDAGARAITMYGIREINDHARHFAKVIQVQAMELNAAVLKLSKPEGINQHIVEIHRLENEADDVYYRAIAELFNNSSSDPTTIIKMKELYEILENATDRCEQVANIIESIILKHN